MASIHGHQVLRMVLSEGAGLTSREALREAIVRRFGREALFHTCSRKDLTVDGLIAFLLERGKIAFTGTAWTAAADEICSDEVEDSP